MKNFKLLSATALILFSMFLISGFTPNHGSAKVDRSSKTMIALIENFTNKSIVTKEQLLKAKKLSLSAPNFTEDVLATFKIEKFAFAIAPKTGSSYIEETTGTMLSSHSKERLADLKPGDLVVIGNINVKDPQGNMIIVPGSTLIVGEN